MKLILPIAALALTACSALGPSIDESGASCVWKAVAKDDGIIIDTSVYGNIWGCEQDTRRLQRAITNTP